MTAKTVAAAARQMPELLPTSSCWFWGSKETTTLRIGSVELEARNDMTAREAFVLYKGLTKGEWQEFAMRRAAMYLQGWSLPQELPIDAADKVELFRAMRRGRFNQLYEVILKHEATIARRIYKGKSYSEAQWGEHCKATKEKLPEWAKLLDYIDPDVSLAADAWFVTEDEGVTLQLPDDQWVRIKSELTQGEHIKIHAVAEKDDKADGGSDANWAGAHKLAFYIQDWSLTYPDGRKAPLGIDSLAEMDAHRFAVLNNTIDAYELNLKKAREQNPTGATS